MASICIYRCYRSGIGKRTGFQETDQKMASTTKCGICKGFWSAFFYIMVEGKCIGVCATCKNEFAAKVGA
jgi:hypothetical protein